MILSYHNKKDSLIEPIATIIASIIAVLGVMKTIDNNNKSNQKMRITQVITKSRIDWMQLIRKFIHGYIEYLNELVYSNDSCEKDKIVTKLFTSRDKIISYLNPEIEETSPDYDILKCLGYYNYDKYIMMIKNCNVDEIKNHKRNLIKITRCYFKSEWERAKEEGYAGKILNNKESKKLFVEKYNKYSNKYKQEL